MSIDIILALMLFGVIGCCGIVSITSSRKREKIEEHIV